MSRIKQVNKDQRTTWQGAWDPRESTIGYVSNYQDQGIHRAMWNGHSKEPARHGC